MIRKKPATPRARGAAATVRPLAAGDLDRVVAIDRALTGRARRGFFEKRLQAALDQPKGFIYVGTEADGTLAGFALARVLEGEFGAGAAVAVLDAIGVDPSRTGQGHGRALMAGLEEVMRAKGVAELQSQVDWTNHALVRFLDKAGFAPAPRLVLGRDTASAV